MQPKAKAQLMCDAVSRPRILAIISLCRRLSTMSVMPGNLARLQQSSQRRHVRDPVR